MPMSASGSPVSTSITELVTMESLFVFQEEYARRDVLAGGYDAALTHNLGGAPSSNVCSVITAGLH